MQTNLTLAASIVEPRPDVATVDQRDACHQFPIAIKVNPLLRCKNSKDNASIHLNILHSVRKFEEEVQCRNTRRSMTIQDAWISGLIEIGIPCMYPCIRQAKIIFYTPTRCKKINLSLHHSLFPFVTSSTEKQDGLVSFLT